MKIKRQEKQYPTKSLTKNKHLTSAKKNENALIVRQKVELLTSQRAKNQTNWLIPFEWLHSNILFKKSNSIIIANPKLVCVTISFVSCMFIRE